MIEEGKKVAVFWREKRNDAKRGYGKKNIIKEIGMHTLGTWESYRD